jgi:hypothetical protein
MVAQYVYLLLRINPLGPNPASNIDKSGPKAPFRLVENHQFSPSRDGRSTKRRKIMQIGVRQFGI